MLPTLKTVAKRFVLEAVVAKIEVDVAFVVVELRPVKFWRVEEPLTKRFANVLSEVKLFISASRVEDAALMTIFDPPLNDTPLMVREFWRRVAVPALPLTDPVMVLSKVLLPLK